MLENSHQRRSHKHSHSPKSLFALTLVAALVSTTVHAQRHHIQHETNGSLVINGKTFGSMFEFQISDEFRTGGHRCGIAPEAQQNAIARDSSLENGGCTLGSTTIDDRWDPRGGAVLRVPVVFHVIRKSDGTGSLTRRQVRSQLTILNEDFRARPGTLGANGADTGIRFFLARQDPEGKPTRGIQFVTNDRFFSDHAAAMRELQWDPDRYLNIYVDDAEGYLGYATLPQISAGDPDDSIHLNWTTVGRDAPDGGIYDQGRTGTHEVGHYLGLFHTFDGGCGRPARPYQSGDLIADTPRQRRANYDCPARARSCSSEDPIENYMNYTQDTCMEGFTLEQAHRMRCSLLTYRPKLVRKGAVSANNGTATIGKIRRSTIRRSKAAQSQSP